MYNKDWNIFKSFKIIFLRYIYIDYFIFVLIFCVFRDKDQMYNMDLMFHLKYYVKNYIFGSLNLIVNIIPHYFAFVLIKMYYYVGINCYKIIIQK